MGGLGVSGDGTRTHWFGACSWGVSGDFTSTRIAAVGNQNETRGEKGLEPLIDCVMRE